MPKSWRYVMVDSRSSEIGGWYAMITLIEKQLSAAECREIARELMQAADEIELENKLDERGS